MARMFRQKVMKLLWIFDYVSMVSDAIEWMWRKTFHSRTGRRKKG